MWASVIRSEVCSRNSSIARRETSEGFWSESAILIFGIEVPEVPRDPKIRAKMLKKRIGTRKVSSNSERLFFNRRKLT